MFDEPDTSQNADPEEVVRELFPPEQNEKHTAAPLRFSLAQLLIATTVAAVLLALFRTLGIFGALASFGAALAFTQGIYPAMKPRDKPQQALMFDFVWGVVMPVVCVVFDPFVFKQSELLQSPNFPWRTTNFNMLQPHAYFAYPAIALQMAVLLAVLIVGRFPPSGAAFLAGVLFLGMFVAGAIGIVLLPISTLGLLMFIGMLGYTPLLTAWAYGRRTGVLWGQAEQELGWKWGIAIAFLGALASAAVPTAIGWFALMLATPP